MHGQSNFWPGKSFYSFPDPDSEDTALDWIFRSGFYGTSYLKFTITIFPMISQLILYGIIFFSYRFNRQ